MKKRSKLNLYLPIILVTLFCLILFFERIYTNENGSGFEFLFNKSNSLTLMSDSEWKKAYKNKDTVYNEKSLVIYDHTLPFSIETRNNIKYVLSTMSVNVYVKDILEINENDDLSDYDTIIICLQNLSTLRYSADKLEEYVNEGGGLLFAVDIIKSDNLSSYFDLLAVNGVVDYLEVDSLIFNDNFLINSKGANFGDMIINGSFLKFDLMDEADIHVSSDDDADVPLVWDHSFGDGYVGVCNASLLTSKNGRGLIAALYSSIHDVFVYPVINSAVYFIDDFPAPIPSGYDEFVMNEYGYSVKDFYANVWWPTMYNITLEKGVKFSSYLIQTYEDNVNGPFDNSYFSEESQYYISELLKSGGEMGIHGYNHQPLVVGNFHYGEDIIYNPWPSSNMALKSIKSVLEYTKSMTNGSKVISYVPPSNILSEELFIKMQEEIPEIKIFAALYVGDGSTLDQEYDVLENGTINFPRLYSGMVLDSDSHYVMLNELSYHYVFSHFIHPDDILDVERRSPKGFAYMTDKYNELIDFINSIKIRNTTISEAGAALERYQVTTVDRKYSNNRLELNISGLVDEVFYFLKTNGKDVKSARGCTFDEISEGYYLLRINNNLVEIEMG